MLLDGNDQRKRLLLTHLITTFKNDILFLMRICFSLLACLFAKGQNAFMFRLLLPREADAALKKGQNNLLGNCFRHSWSSEAVCGVIPEGFLDVAVIEFHREKLELT